MKKTAFITGGCRGIGLGISKEFISRGFDLAVMGSGSEEHYAETLAELRKNADVLYIQADLADTSAARAAVDKAFGHFGRIDVLVNNAGVAPKVRADLLEMSEESFDYVFGTNCRGTMFLTQAAANRMKLQEPEDGRRGIIINMSSISAEVSSTNRGEYCVSKAGISMLTLLFADRLAGEGIFVYEIRPGIISSDMTGKVKDKYDAFFAQGGAPIARWGTPEDVGKAAASLCSGDFAYSTGQVVFVDGGMHIQRL
ncbi:MAG: 3-ketoacyl-ACP reductase [Firmicutes bacterium]|nr:3-ketoacyl-ACP reductase [Bacillota bacterium]